MTELTPERIDFIKNLYRGIETYLDEEGVCHKGWAPGMKPKSILLGMRYIYITQQELAALLEVSTIRVYYYLNPKAKEKLKERRKEYIGIYMKEYYKRKKELLIRS